MVAMADPCRAFPFDAGSGAFFFERLASSELLLQGQFGKPMTAKASLYRGTFP